jgi:hypothetical protein
MGMNLLQMPVGFVTRNHAVCIHTHNVNVNICSHMFVFAKGSLQAHTCNSYVHCIQKSQGCESVFATCCNYRLVQE